MQNFIQNTRNVLSSFVSGFQKNVIYFHIQPKAAEKGSCCPPPPRRGTGGKHIVLPPPSRYLERGPRKNCVENARNSITPNIPLLETGQVRKIGASRLPKGVPQIQGPSHIGLPPLENTFRLHCMNLERQKIAFQESNAITFTCFLPLHRQK